MASSFSFPSRGFKSTFLPLAGLESSKLGVRLLAALNSGVVIRASVSNSTTSVISQRSSYVLDKPLATVAPSQAAFSRRGDDDTFFRSVC